MSTFSRTCLIYGGVFFSSFVLPLGLKHLIHPPASHRTVFVVSVFVAPAAFLALGAWIGKSCLHRHALVLSVGILLSYLTYPADPLMDFMREVDRRWVPDLINIYLAGAILNLFFQFRSSPKPVSLST